MIWHRLLFIGNLVPPPVVRNADDQPLRRSYGSVPYWAVATALWARVTMFIVLAAGVPAIVRQFWQPPWSLGQSVLGLVTAFFIFDLSVYLFHRAQHRSDWLWRRHAIHHSDPEIDITTTLYHHPADIAMGALLIWSDIIFLNTPLWSAAAFAIIFFLTALWSHSAPRAWDPYLDAALVTPTMHRRHHAADRDLAASNYGLVTSLWDHVFGTFRPTPPDLIIFGIQHF